VLLTLEKVDANDITLNKMKKEKKERKTYHAIRTVMLLIIYFRYSEDKGMISLSNLLTLSVPDVGYSLLHASRGTYSCLCNTCMHKADRGETTFKSV
jgi:hypothetical protein